MGGGGRYIIEDYGGDDRLGPKVGDGGEAGETVLVIVVEEEGGERPHER